MSLTAPEALAASVAHLVQIPSVTPLQAAEQHNLAGEARVAACIAERCRALGAEVLLDDVASGRPNVYALFPGQTQRLAALYQRWWLE